MSVIVSPKRVHRSLASRLVGIVLSLLSLVVIGLLFYIILYHDAPPIPGTEKFFQNVDYGIKSQGGGILKEGFYFWTITNNNDFAWPAAWIAYGETHGYLLGRVEAGESVKFTNGILQNMETKAFESIPLIEGSEVEILLWIDFAEEDYWVIQVQKLFKYTKRYYSTGVWSQ
jgi:hypothetical protein